MSLQLMLPVNCYAAVYVPRLVYIYQNGTALHLVLYCLTAAVSQTV